MKNALYAISQHSLSNVEVTLKVPFMPFFITNFYLTRMASSMPFCTTVTESDGNE